MCVTRAHTDGHGHTHMLRHILLQTDLQTTRYRQTHKRGRKDTSVELRNTVAQHNVLQCGAVCCIVLQCVAVCCNMLQTPQQNCATQTPPYTHQTHCRSIYIHTHIHIHMHMRCVYILSTVAAYRHNSLPHPRQLHSHMGTQS